MRQAFRISVAVISMAAGTVPAIAQTVPVETRVDRLEKEMKAVQRKVFPGGTPVEPAITAAPPVTTTTPSSTPVSDLIARVDTLEAQLATMTGQIEQNNFKIKQLEDSFARYKAEVDGKFAAAAPAPAAPVAVAAPTVTPKPAPKPAASTPPAAKPTVKPAATTPAIEARKEAVGAIEVPDTGVGPEDAYVYGYRLWAAKFYPEAQAQLKYTLDKYGTSNVASKAQNLLGRAYLDDGKPALASVAFYENYQKRPRGERAADSLAWLGEALIQLKKPADACKVYTELEQAYGTTLSASLRGMMEKGRTRAKCGA
ncbi:tetratricopeptide repeat protein [Sphingobium subterraneum]|uniref:TolA-binding protein n=1 Tax=Sphingobium subterraneum TaxID=627688 RepID=A0A841J4Q7_9SPHN|nr:hypothetical protein [Sphingobium subterraneum]MBB6123518.1 TolA-binding protein [Sphingobium subterraneum]